MVKINFQSIDEYHNFFTGDAHTKMQSIRELVHSVVPEAEEIISYQIPAFKIGRNFYLIYYSAFEKHISISSPWSEVMLKEFDPDLIGFKVSKSAIRFPHDNPLPIELIRRILEFRKTEYEMK